MNYTKFLGCMFLVINTASCSGSTDVVSDGTGGKSGGSAGAAGTAGTAGGTAGGGGSAGTSGDSGAAGSAGAGLGGMAGAAGSAGTAGSSGSGGTTNCATSDKCAECCATTNPAASAKLIGYASECLCQPNVCQTACEASSCKESPDLPDEACQTCIEPYLQGQCSSAAFSCMGDAECKPVVDCLLKCPR